MKDFNAWLCDLTESLQEEDRGVFKPQACECLGFLQDCPDCGGETAQVYVDSFHHAVMAYSGPLAAGVRLHEEMETQVEAYQRYIVRPRVDVTDESLTATEVSVRQRVVESMARCHDRRLRAYVLAFARRMIEAGYLEDDQ